MKNQDHEKVENGRPGFWRVAGFLAGLLPVFSIVWALQVAPSLGIALFKEQFLAVTLGLALGALYLAVPMRRGAQRQFLWLDGFLAVLSVGTLSYIAFDYERFQLDFPFQTKEMLVLGTLVFVLVMEALRRATGLVLFNIVLFFMGYALVGHLVPAPLTGRENDLPSLLPYLGFDPNAALGTPMSVAATIVILFILFGRFLMKSGCGEFFIDLSAAGMGRQRGGSAKISVLGSALFGSISGSAISNVATTGVMTIPLMRRSGYSAAQAGAIETVASTGGQMMPPIMGAAAFLIAEFLEVPYAEVVVAALVPALLYYFAVFIQVDLIAARSHIKVVEENLPKMREVLRKGWHFLIPFVVLLLALFVLNVEAEIAALYAAVIIVLGGGMRTYKGHRLLWKDVPGVFRDAGMAMLELIVIVAAAGFVIGILNITSGGFALTLFLVQLGSENFAVLLIISAGVCILLGMGMPTSGVYVLLAPLIAPALIQTGVEPMSAHMFILYFGMMSMITPPIALAAFAAATISGANPMRTGFESVRLGWVAYVVPILFVLSPTLILRGEFIEMVTNIVTCGIGVYFASIAAIGYFRRKMGPIFRTFLAIVGIAAMVPQANIGIGGLIGFAAVALGVVLLGREYIVTRPSPSGI